MAKMIKTANCCTIVLFVAIIIIYCSQIFVAGVVQDGHCAEGSFHLQVGRCTSACRTWRVTGHTLWGLDSRLPY